MFLGYVEEHVLAKDILHHYKHVRFSANTSRSLIDRNPNTSCEEIPIFKGRGENVSTYRYLSLRAKG